MTCKLMSKQAVWYEYSKTVVLGGKDEVLVRVFLRAFAKLWTTTISFVMSVCPFATTRLPLEGHS